MARKYRILNTEPGVFYAQRSATGWGWVNLYPFRCYKAGFDDIQSARDRIDADIRIGLATAKADAERRAALRGYPKVIPYRR